MFVHVCLLHSHYIVVPFNPATVPLMWNYLQGQVYLTRIASDSYVGSHYLGRKLNAYHFPYILNLCNHPHNLSNNFQHMLALFFFSICGLQHDLIYSRLVINTLQPIERIQKVKLWVGKAKEPVNTIGRGYSQSITNLLHLFIVNKEICVPTTFLDFI